MAWSKPHALASPPESFARAYGQGSAPIPRIRTKPPYFFAIFSFGTFFSSPSVESDVFL